MRRPIEHRLQPYVSLEQQSPDSATCDALRAVLANPQVIASKWSERHLSFAGIFDAVKRDSGNQDCMEFYRVSYLLPLLRLLRGALIPGNSIWKAVYMDERARFAIPDDVAFAANEQLGEQLIAGDMIDLVQRVPKDLQSSATRFLAAFHQSTENKPGKRFVRLLLIGDCVMTELRAFLATRCEDFGAQIRVRHQYMSFERGNGLNISSIADHVKAGNADIISFSFFTFEGLPLYRALLEDAVRLSDIERRDRVVALLRLVRQIIDSVRAVSDIPIMLHTASGLPLNKWRRLIPVGFAFSVARRKTVEDLNRGLRDLANGVTNLIIIDEEVAVRRAGGLRNAAANFFPRALRRKALFHTTAFGPLLADLYAPVLAAYFRLSCVKVLCVDFDNTLWAGVMAEGAVKHDRRAQRILRRVREAGILLVALSKNDPRSIRWNEMELDPDDFVLHKINWNQKTQSVEEVAQLLNLGLDAFAVLDDNPAERVLIADRFPQVQLFNPLESQTWDAIELMLLFPNTRPTAESSVRTALYREAALRREAMVPNLNYPEMMVGLQLRTHWSVAVEKQVDRICELLQRTNQFNTTTRRRTTSELRAVMRDPQFAVFVFTLADRFGDLGIVGVVIVERAENKITFDSVVMSCRAMGFGVEGLLVAAPLVKLLELDGARRRAFGLFVSTDRNEPASAVFANAGFVAQGEMWVLAPDAPLPNVPEWLTVTTS